MEPSMVLVPARRASTRLPDKPLALIAGEPMIVHVWRRAVEADCGRVIVATDDREIADVIEGAGGMAVMTASHHASGSDRIFEALEAIDPAGEAEIIINL
ncbi:MAG: NTP transferase domain-containing protein, partial [Rhizobiales bacterium]|nr:NTP transferase domain-containing protein [Hyphomicrobiales bacterium]